MTSSRRPRLARTPLGPGLLSLCGVTVLLVGGCVEHRDDEARLGLPTQVVRRAVDPARVIEREGLLGALRMAPADRDRALGPVRRTVHTVTRVTPAGGAEEALDESVRLDTDGQGALHVVRDYTRGRGDPVASAASPGGSSGMEAVLLAGPPPERLFVRPRFGTFIRRRPEPGEAERLRRLGDETLAATLELLQHGAELRDGGTRIEGGRTVRTLRLERSESPRSAPESAAAGQAWRATVEVIALEGQVEVDAATGAPLGAAVRATYRFLREGVKVEVRVVHDESCGPPDPVVAPAEWAPLPERPRPMLDRQALLDDLAPSRRSRPSRGTP
jgi:hypothetical protein